MMILTYNFLIRKYFYDVKGLVTSNTDVNYENESPVSHES